MKAVLLAAGEGVRLLPITASRPKHLIQVGGKPILQHCLEALKLCGITEVVVVTYYMSAAIRSYFGDGAKFGFKIKYVEQSAVMGTGNAVGITEPHIKDDFVVVYADLLFGQQALQAVIETYHKQHKPAAVMAVVPVDKPENYGIIELTKENHVKRVIEKPNCKEAPSNLANAGLYIFSSEIFDVLRKVKKSIRGEYELTDAITLLSEAKKTVLAIKISKDDWFDIGRPWDLLDANAWTLKRMEHRVLGKIEQGAHLLGPVTVAETARVRSGAYIEGPCFIDEGADVGPNCFIRPCTSIGKNSRIGNACEIKNSIIMDGTHIGHLSYVGDSVLCEKCNLGAGTITANLRLDDCTVKMMIKDQLIDTGRRKLGAILGDNVKTGVNSVLMPGVKVGNNCCVGPNVIVERDLAPGTMAMLQQSLDKKKILP
ncbi:MAG: sugar phosphate nucleotidyltransferase [Candidatus Bathyarchaeota archaeon]|nr:sugar phosphate nucleotidyltransferase [Candidatus Bathyarchaeota archaeon]